MTTHVSAGLYASFGSSFFSTENSPFAATKRSAPEISPSIEPQPQPFLPSLAPSPLTPYTNKTLPTLSGIFLLPLQ